MLISDVCEQQNKLMHMCYTCKQNAPPSLEKTNLLDYFSAILKKIGTLVAENKSLCNHRECHKAEKQLSRLLEQLSIPAMFPSEMTKQELLENSLTLASHLEKQDLSRALAES